MNYFDKFDAKHYADAGSDAHSGAHLHLDSGSGHAPSGTVVVPDAELLFTGDFKRSGVDLILSKDGRELVLQDYFKGEKRAVLASPDGAQLSGDLVNALSGHVEYAQAAGASDAATIIGHVTKVTGSATALRNGVVITLNEGDNVAKGDVVQTGSDSQLGITFIDGSVFGLSSKARMVLNEMVYDPNGSNNSSLLSLVAGTISFVAGETAKHGDMKVNTPVATMGIRGTAPLAEIPELVEIDFNVPAPGGPVKFQVLTERDGHTGSYILYSLTDPTVQIGTVNQAGLVTAVTGLGQITTSPAPPLSPAAIAIIGPVFEQFFQNAQQQPNANPQTHSPPPGSTPPAPPPAAKPGDTSPINNLPVGAPTTVPIPINLPAPTPSNPNGVTTVTVPVTITVLKAVNVTPVVDQTSFQIANHVTIADSQPSDALVPFVPGSGTIVSAVGPAGAPANLASLVSIDPQTGTVTYDPANFAFLQSGEKVTVTVGFDSSAGTDTFHETLVLTIDAPAGAAIHWTNANGGDFAVAANWGGGTVPGAGDNVAIDAVGTYTVTSAVNESVNSLAVASGATLDVIGGTFTIENGTGAGGNAGTILADGIGGQVVLNGDITNTGTLEATAGGDLEIVGASIANAGGTIETVVDPERPATSQVDLDGATIVGGTLVVGGNSDFVDVEDAGATLDGVMVNLVDGGSQIDVGLAGPSTLLLNDGTTITGAGSTLINDGVLDVEVGPQGHGNPDATLDGIEVTNNGTIDVGTTTSGALLTLENTSITGGKLNIGAGGEVYVQGATLDGVTVTNDGGLELGSGSTLSLEGGTTITGGTLTFREGGDEISVAKVNGFDPTKPDATLDHVTVNNVGSIDVISGAILVLDDGTTVTGGTSATNLGIGSGGTLEIEPGAINGHGATLNNVSVSSTDFTSAIKVGGGSTLTLNGTTINGGTIDDFSAATVPSGPIIPGDIDVTGSSEFEHTVLNNGNVKVEAGQTLTLDNVSLVATGFMHTVQIDDTASGAILQIDGGDTLTLNGATIEGGIINAFSPPIGTGSIIAGDIDVAGSSTINGGAVLNNGDVTVESGTILTLDNVTVNGTSFTDTASGAILQIDGGDTLTLQKGASITGGTLSNFGTLAIEQGAVGSGATLDGVTVSNSGNVQVDTPVAAASTLTLDDGTTISGGTLTIGGVGTLDVELGADGLGATLKNVTVSSTDLTSIIKVGGGGTLTLNGATISGGTINDSSLDASGDVIPGDIDVTVSSTIDSGAVINKGDVTVGGGATLKLDNVTVNGTSFTDTATGAILQIDGGDTLTLNGATIDGGTINDFSGLIGAAGGIPGDIDVTGSSTINGGAVLNSGDVTLEKNITLKLDNVTVNGTSFTDTASGAILQIDGNDTLTLSGATISGGTIDAFSPPIGTGSIIAGEIDVTGSSTIDGGATLNNGNVTIESNQTLTLSGASITGGTLSNFGTLAIEQGAVGSGATLDGVTVVNSGNVQVDTPVAATSILTLDDGTTISGATLAIGSAGVLDIEVGPNGQGGANGLGNPDATLDGVKVTNSGTINVDPAASGAVLMLDHGTTVTGGALHIGGSGEVYVQNNGASFGATLDGVAVTNAGSLEIGGPTGGGSTLILEGGTTISGGTLALLQPGDVVDVEVGADATLDGVTVVNSGTIVVVTNLNGNGASLTLDGGTTISDGTLTVGADSMLTLNDVIISDSLINQRGSSSGSIDVTGPSTLNEGTVLNDSAVTVESHATLTLDDVSAFGDIFFDTASGAALQVDGTHVLTLDLTTIEGGTINDAGEIDITGSASTISDGAVINNGTVTVASGIKLTLDNATVNDTSFDDTASGAILQIGGGSTLTLNGATISGGTINDFSPPITPSGSIIAGDIDVTGSSTINGGAVLNNGDVTVASGVTLTLDDVTVNGTAFTGAGTIDLGQGTSIAFEGTQTFDSATVVITDGFTRLSENNNGTLTLGSHLTIDASSFFGELASSAGSAIVNDGTINAEAAGGNFTIDPAIFTNNGTITVSNGDTLGIDATTWTNTGSITVDANSTLGLGSNFTTADLAGITNNGGTVIIEGTLTNTGQTVTVGSTAALGHVVLEGTVNGGTIVDQGSGIHFEGGELDNVTYDGTLDLTPPNSQLRIVGGLTATGLNGTGPGTIGLGAGSSFIFEDTETFDHATITMNPGTSPGPIIPGVFEESGTLTLGSNLTIDSQTGSGELGSFNGSAIVNNGLIKAEASGGTFTINPATFTNNGSITVSNGDTLTVNTGKQVANSGLLAASTGSTLVVDDAVTGTGSATIADSGILKFQSSVSSGQTVTFTGNGILSLGQPSGFAGEIDGFSGGDILDLAGFNAATTSVTPSFDGADTTLTVTGGASPASITLDGDYSADHFGAFSDGHGGSFVVLNPAVIPTITSNTQGSGPLNFSPTTSAVFELQGETISVVNGPQDINSPDAHSADSIILEIDAASSISVSGGSPSTPNNGANLTSAGASLEIFNAAGNITASGSGSSGIFAAAQAANGNTTSGNVAISDLSNTAVSGDANGIKAVAANGTNGAGDVTVNVYANAAIDANVNISSVGILAINEDTGNITVTTSSGDSITAGSSGINAINEDTSIAASANSVIDVDASGSIHSGTNIFASGNNPAGILVGYQGGPPSTTNSFDPNLFGNVFVNNSADITADGGDGIRAFNFGTGDVTVHDNAGSITALGGTNPANGTGNGIDARNSGGGNIVVTTGADTSIDSGGSGINVFNLSTSVPSNSSISVVAEGAIVAGNIPTALGNLAAGIVAGYNSSTLANPATAPVPGVHGNVTIDDFGSITAAAGDDGIRGLNDGTGTVTITAETGAVITAAAGALNFGLDAVGDDGGDVSITNFGSVTAGTDAINAQTTGAGKSTIDNHGQLFGDVAGNNAIFTNELNADWSLNGTSVFTTTLTGHSTLTNLGTIESNGTSEISGLSSFTNTGTIEVQSGSLKIDTAVSGAGTATIDGGTLEFGAASDAHVHFSSSESASGTLVLDNPAGFTGTISGITAHGDTIDLVGISPASTSLVFNPTSGALELHDGAGPNQFISITGGIVASAGSNSPTFFSEHSDGHDGTDVVFDQGPVIDTSQFVVSMNGNTTTIQGLSVSDANANAFPNETFNISAETANAALGTSVTPSSDTDLLTGINSTLETGITYNPGATPPPTDKVTLTVADSFGATDTVNFVFNEAGNSATTVLNGTPGKDVIFATGHQDILTGGGGQDQFVFKPTLSPLPVQHTVTDFVAGLDKIDVRQFSNVSASNVLADAHQQNNDTLITLDANDSVLLKNVVAANLHANDFIVHA